MDIEIQRKTIENRDDVSLLVRSFYTKIRRDEMLGPIFNNAIKDWEPHLEKLTDFWEGNLFFFVKTKYAGDPKIAHNALDLHLHKSLTMNHFGHWINLWLETIEEHFTGETAERAKMIARKMASFLFLKIVENRS
ncbi:MAG: group III truncated hemoglobin [Saprospiraceae bacterium]|nr:group III truncated hemoglobin [Saprospiraceae bacterium]MCF8252794.1 group III truncated hemoglobin [Saprospiraceae bacterium]MCF8283220.1 group III truncated hemoglobin [Bacteroidales bacterium]MCF8314349.1 group III truncated hemoglobin [Saprospiraceae bacterium]MCF8443217.1 group III truncated hemoglobin [Saprospiraceae bacterium]